MKKIIAFGIVFTPMLLLAAPITNVGTAFTEIKGWMNTLTLLVFSAAILYFLYGVFNFVRSAGDETKRQEGRMQLIYGIIGLAVMASIYGLINFVGSSTVGIGGQSVSAPTLPF